MRKLSELLRICIKYNYYFTGGMDHPLGMCVVADHLHYDKTEDEEDYLSLKEYSLVEKECSKLVKEIALDDYESHLIDALDDRFNFESEEELESAYRNIYLAWIDKLESEGK